MLERQENKHAGPQKGPFAEPGMQVCREVSGQQGQRAWPEPQTLPWSRTRLLPLG